MGRFSLLILALSGACIPVPMPRAEPQYEPACYPKKDEKAKDAPTFISLGNDARDRALAAENARLVSTSPFRDPMFSVWSVELREARDCYERAERVHPDSYESALGLGIVYFLVGIRSDAALAGPMLTRARLNLGKAYFLRSDQHDPLLYLAFVSIVERRFDAANQILGHLQEKRHKLGDVLVLRGYAAELAGDPAQGRQLFQQAIEAGGSSETLSYASYRLRMRP